MNTNAVSHAVVLEFLGNKFPFSELDPSHLKKFARRATIDFFPKGTLILRQEESDVNHFYVIQKGGVRSYRVDAQGNMTLKDFRGEREHFGALPIIQNTTANLNIITLDDTFCFVFDKKDFLNLLETSPKEEVFQSSLTNAVVYGDSPDESTDREAKEYFRTLSQHTIWHLVACGYPQGTGYITAANAQWRQPQSNWNGYFRDWCGFPDRERNFDPIIFFDIRSGAGNASLAEKLKEQAHTLTRGDAQFLRYLAQDFICRNLRNTMLFRMRCKPLTSSYT